MNIRWGKYRLCQQEESNPEKLSSRFSELSCRSRKARSKKYGVGTKQMGGKENKFEKGRERASVWSKGYQKPAQQIVDQ